VLKELIISLRSEWVEKREKKSFSGSVSVDTVCATLVISFTIGNFITSNFNHV
jgi:hypothetical protein